MAKLLVLGSGTVFSQTVLGSEEPRTHPGYYLSWGNGPRDHLLLECSQGIAERLRRSGVHPRHVRNVAISHAHADHFALPQFLLAMFCDAMAAGELEILQGEEYADKLGSRLLLFVPGHIQKSISDLQRVHFEETKQYSSLGGEQFGLSWPLVLSFTSRATDRLFGTGDMYTTLDMYGVYHGFGKVDALAFRLEHRDESQAFTFAYSGDTGECEGVRQACDRADVFVCEASARVGANDMVTGYGHLTPHHAGLIARDGVVSHLVLTHYSGYDSDEVIAADCRKSGFGGKLTIAKDGMEITF